MVSNASWKRTMNEGITVERYTGINFINYSILFRYYVISINYSTLLSINSIILDYLLNFPFLINLTFYSICLFEIA